MGVVLPGKFYAIFNSAGLGGSGLSPWEVPRAHSSPYGRGIRDWIDDCITCIAGLRPNIRRLERLITDADVNYPSWMTGWTRQTVRILGHFRKS